MVLHIFHVYRSHRIAQYLEKVGLLQRDIDNTCLDLPIDDEDSLLVLQAASSGLICQLLHCSGKGYWQESIHLANIASQRFGKLWPISKDNWI